MVVPDKRRASHWRNPKARIKLEIRGRDGVIRPAFNKDPATGCWLSTGAPTGNGYCRTSNTTAQRDAYQRAEGEIPPLFQCHHLCEARSCVNPRHIIAVSNNDHAKIHAFLRDQRKKDRDGE